MRGNFPVWLHGKKMARNSRFSNQHHDMNRNETEGVKPTDVLHCRGSSTYNRHTHTFKKNKTKKQNHTVYNYIKVSNIVQKKGLDLYCIPRITTKKSFFSLIQARRNLYYLTRKHVARGSDTSCTYSIAGSLSWSSCSWRIAKFVLSVELLHACLSHEVGDVLLQVVDAGAHLVECAG